MSAVAKRGRTRSRRHRLFTATSELVAAASVASLAAISRLRIIVPEPARWPVEGERSAILAANP